MVNVTTEITDNVTLNNSIVISGDDRKYYYVALSFNFAKCSISPIILVGNGLTVAIVTKSATMKLPSYVLIASLATFDFLVGLVPWLQLVLLLSEKTLYWNHLCMVVMLMEAYTSGLDVVCIIFIAIERFIFVTKFNIYNKYIMRNRVKRFMVGLSVILLILGVVYLIMRKIETRYGICYWQLMTDKKLTKFFLAPWFVINTVLLFLLYVKIISFVWKRRQVVVRTISHAPGHGHPDNYKLQKKTTRMMAIVLGIYLITDMPLGLYILIMPEDISPWQLILLDTGTLILYSNAAINPFVYARKSPEFRTAYRKMFGKCCKRPSSGNPRQATQ